MGELRKELESLADKGLYLDAARAGESVDFFKDAKSMEDYCIAARIAICLGHERHAHYLLLKAKRKFKKELPFRYESFLWGRNHHSEWSQWRKINKALKTLDEFSGDDLECLLLGAADSYARFKLVDAAGGFLDKAEKLEVNPALVSLERVRLAHHLENRALALDLCAETIEKCRADVKKTGYPATFCSIASFYRAYGEDEKMWQLLEECNERFQFFRSLIQSASYCIDDRYFERAEKYLEQTEPYRKYFDDGGNFALNLKLYDISIEKRDLKNAFLLSEKLSKDSKFFGEINKKLKETKDDCDSPRIILDVPLVYQYEKTCVPATLVSLAAYFGEKLDHDALADEICTDGTSNLKTIKWAEKNNWIIRPFVVDADAVWALIQRKIPFALYTRNAGGGHCQAAVGFDKATGELIIREPGSTVLAASHLDLLLKEQAASGPMGCVFCPGEKSSLLDGIVFPGEKGCLVFFDVLRKLEAHCPEDAEAILDEFEKKEPDHPFNLLARLDIMQYRQARGIALELRRKIYEKYPESEFAAWDYISYLSGSENGVLKRKILKEYCDKDNVDAMFYQELAYLLSFDKRTEEEAFGLSRKALEQSPYSGINYHVCGFLLNHTKDKEGASFDAHMIASCLEPYNHHFAEEWFEIAREERRHEEVLDILDKRRLRLERKTSDPAIMLTSCLRKLNRHSEALEVLKKQIDIFDGDHSAERFLLSFQGEMSDPEKALKRALELQGEIHEIIWTLLVADLYDACGCPSDALDLLSEKLKAHPFNAAVFRRFAWLKFPREDDPERFLSNLLEEYGNYGIEHLELIAEQARTAGLHDLYEKAVRSILDIDPQHSWWLRDLGFHCHMLGRNDEAWKICGNLKSFTNACAENYGLEGAILLSEGKNGEALEIFLKALSENISYRYAMDRIPECLPDDDGERSRVFEQICKLLEEPVIDNNAVYGVAELAENLLSQSHVEEILLKIKENRPDMPASWWALIDFYESSEKGLEYIEEARLQLPHLADSLDYRKAQILETLGRTSEAIELLTKVVEDFPGFARARAYLAVLYGDIDREEDADIEFQKAIEIAPMDGLIAAWRSRAFSNRGRLKDALEAIDCALARSPRNISLLYERLAILMRMNENEKALAFSREILEIHPYDVSFMLKHVDALMDAGMLQEAFATLEKAEKLFPGNFDVNLKKINLLMNQRRFDEAYETAGKAAKRCAQPQRFILSQAKVRYSEGKMDEALDLVHKVIEKFPYYVYARTLLINYLRDAEKFDEALAVCQTAARDFPEIPYYKSVEGEIYEENMDNIVKAEKIYKAVLKEHQGYVSCLCGIFDINMKKGGRHSFNNAFNEVLAYSPSMQNPYLGWRMALAAFAGGRKNDAREWLESFVKTDNPEMQHLYELIIQRMPESFFKRRFFLNELWRQCQANPENFELLRAYVYACISWLNPEVILTRHGIYSRVFKALRLAFDESCPNWNAASYIIENLDILSGSWLVNLYVFFKREKIMSNCSLRFAMARYYLSVKRPKKILKCLENDSRNLMRSFDEAFTIIYAYQALGRYEEAKEIFETARLSLPYDRFRLPDTSACMLFIYAVEENWKKCKELKADLENNVANLCGYSEWLYNSALLVCSVEKPDDLEAGWLWRCKDKLSGWPGGKCMSLRRAKKDFKRIFRKYKKTAKLNQKLIN